MANLLIGIGIVLIGVGISVLPRHMKQSEPPKEQIITIESEITDGKKLVQKNWQTVLPYDHKRFIEMIAHVNGERKLVGAWDTVRGEGLFFPEYKNLFKTPN